MKRHALKRLQLTTEAVRTLRPVEIARAVGGLGGTSAGPRGNSCNSCPCTGSHNCPE